MQQFAASILDNEDYMARLDKKHELGDCEDYFVINARHLNCLVLDHLSVLYKDVVRHQPGSRVVY